LRYSAEWQDDATNLAPEERATVADLRLWLDQQNICLHLQGTKSVDHITVPLYALTEGLAHDWWTLFGDATISCRFSDIAVVMTFRTSEWRTMERLSRYRLNNGSIQIQIYAFGLAHHR